MTAPAPSPGDTSSGPAPSVEVVIPTRDRPELVRRAIESVLCQRYDGALGVVVVFDGQPPDLLLVRDGARPVRVLRNTRTPGLAGARNSGILSSSADLVAFLDDDDRWLPGKLERQVARLTGDPGVPLATASVCYNFRGTRTVRLAGTSLVTHAQLVSSRMAMLHSSGFLFRREALLDGPGLVDETAPSSQNEDWELLLRYSAVHPIAHVDEPLVEIRWGGSQFAQAWRSRIDGAEWVLAKHPEIRADPVGYARLLGQIAFGHAAIGRRRKAFGLARAAMRIRRQEPRAYLAMAAAAGVPTTAIQSALHRVGHGI